MLRVIPLGGLGEIGLNTLVLEHGDDRLLIDCGLMFPRLDQPGVDVVLPDYSYLLQAVGGITGIVLTHAHEDHLGALPWLLRELQAPVYGSPFTLALARHKLDEAGMKADLRDIGPGEPFSIGSDFSLEPVRVAHSVPDALGFIVNTPSATLVHTGDFKLDGMPVDGQITDLARLAEAGEEGVDVLLSDSTNAEVPGESPSEQRVVETFARLLSGATGRFFVTMFSSHLHRINTLLTLAQQVGRKVAIQGRSLERNVMLARQVQLLNAPEGLILPLEDVAGLPPEKGLILCTGAQAEGRSGLLTLLSSDPGRLRIRQGDTVVFSSRTIPGNEPFVTRAINLALAKGAIVFHPAIEPGVHVSGHAASGEQRRMLRAVKPKAFVPIHGELRHLTRHAAMAREEGVAHANALLMTDGDAAGFDAAGPRVLHPVTAGQRLLRREGLAAVPLETIAERRALAESGTVVVAVVLQRGSGLLMSGPTVQAHGLSAEELAVLALAQEGAKQALLEVSEAIRGDDARVREALVFGIRRVYRQALGSRPLVLPMVLRL